MIRARSALAVLNVIGWLYRPSSGGPTKLQRSAEKQFFRFNAGTGARNQKV
jgi:hypothetical protein